jgi:hypothetical protein
MSSRLNRRDFHSQIKLGLGIGGALITAGLMPGIAMSDAGLVDIAVTAGIAETSGSYGAYVTDYNGDGLSDFLYSKVMGLRLYRNSGNGRFEEDNRTDFGSRDRLGCAWDDVNRDGLQDFFCAVGAGHGTLTKANQLWVQQADGTFSEQAEAMGVIDPYGRGRAAVWFNYNGDDYPDLFVGNHSPRVDDYPSPNRVFVNLVGDAFEEAVIEGVTAELGAICAFAIDLDQDDYDDLLVCGKDNRLFVYRNQGGTGFEDKANSIGPGSTIDAVADDVTGDGKPDLILVGKDGRVCIMPNSGGWAFGPKECYGSDVRRAITVDLDGNGILDIYAGRRGTSPNLPDLLLQNDGSGRFTPLSVGASTTEGTGNRVRLAAIDHDGDGQEGVLVVNAAGGAIKGPLELMVRSDAPAIPAAPSDLAATVISSTQVTLVWTDNSSNETAFRIQRKVGPGGTWKVIKTVRMNITTYTDTSVRGGGTYRYRVRAVNASGRSAWSNITVTKTP